MTYFTVHGVPAMMWLHGPVAKETRDFASQGPFGLRYITLLLMKKNYDVDYVTH